MLIVVTVLVGLYLYYNPNSPLSFPFYNTSVKNNNISNSNENDIAVTPINTPLSRKQVSADNLTLYEIRIIKKTEVKTNENILEIFKRILGLPEISRSNLKFGEFDTKSPIVSIFIDERKDTLENIFINDALSGTAFLAVLLYSFRKSQIRFK